MTTLILDTGPLVAYLARRERHHGWSVELFNEVEPPFFTCEAVLSEATFLLRNIDGGPDLVLEMVERGLIDTAFSAGNEIGPIRHLLKKYASVPMSLADACLVRMSELERDCKVVTLDSDFRVYRRNRRLVVPTIMPK